MARLQNLKSAMLPAAILTGAVFHRWMGTLTWLSPYLLFMMLFVTYCRLDLRQVRPGRFQWALLIVQTVLSGLVFVALLPAGRTVAQGVFMCVFVPTATAAPVITMMLGGSVARVATYALLSNVFIALAAPVVLAAVGDAGTLTFARSMLLILGKVMPLLLLPVVAALVLRRLWPRAHTAIARSQQLSFYMWAATLVIVVGSCVSFVISHWQPSSATTMILLSLGALAVCLMQFKVGRAVGRRYGDAVAGGQGLAQKNTVLAVWLALTYMDPVASVGPAAYIVWQNLVNSWQLMHRTN